MITVRHVSAPNDIYIQRERERERETEDDREDDDSISAISFCIHFTNLLLWC
jgi:hypothetical protein